MEEQERSYKPHLAAIALTIVFWLIIINIKIVPIQVEMYNEDLMYYTMDTTNTYLEAAKFGFSGTTHRVTMPDLSEQSVVQKADMLVVAVISLIWLPILILSFFTAKDYFAKREKETGEAEDAGAEESGEAGAEEPKHTGRDERDG